MSNPLDTIIAELRKQADAATLGPWSNLNGKGKPATQVKRTDIQNEFGYRAAVCNMYSRPSGEAKAEARSTAAFIAAARTLVPALLDALAAMRSQRNEAHYNAQTGPDFANRYIAEDDADIARVLKGIANERT